MGDYLTTSEAKEYLQDLGADYDTLLGKIITRASRDIDSMTGQFFDTKAGVTNLFDGPGSRVLRLPWAWPLITITTLRVAAYTGGSLTTVSSSDYFLEPANRPTGTPARKVELSNIPAGTIPYFYSGKRTVSIQGDWGWTATPDEIKEVCAEMVIRAFKQRGAAGEEFAGVDGFDLDKLPRALSPRAQAILKNYGWRKQFVA